MKKIKSILISIIFLSQLLYPPSHLNSASFLASPGISHLPQSLHIAFRKFPYQLWPTDNFGEKEPDWLQEETLLQKVPYIYYDYKKKHWINTDQNKHLTSSNKGIVPVKIKPHQFMWFNKAIESLSEKEKRILAQNPDTRFIFIKDHDNKAYSYVDDIKKNGCLRGYSLSYPLFYFDIRMLDDPLALSDTLANHISEKEYILELLTQKEKYLIHIDDETYEKLEKQEKDLESKLEKIQKKMNVLLKSEKLTILTSQNKTEKASLNQPTPPNQDKRQRLLKYAVYKSAEKIFGGRSHSFMHALSILDYVLRDENVPGNGEATRIVENHEIDLINLVKLSRNKPDLQIAVIKLFAQVRKFEKTSFNPDMKDFIINDLISIAVNKKSPNTLKSAALYLIRSCAEVVKEDHDKRIENVLIPEIKKIINNSRDQYLKADAIFTLWALALDGDLNSAKQFLEEKSSLFEKYISHNMHPALVKASILALELIWKRINKDSKRFDDLINRFIFNNNSSQKIYFKRPLAYGIKEIRQGIIAQKMPLLSTILLNDGYLSRFITVITVLRIAYPYHHINGSPLTPIAWAKSNNAIFKLMDGTEKELYFTPVSESFRRHIFFTEDETCAVELKIPGERESSNFVSRTHYSLAKKIHEKYPHDPGVPEPLFYLSIKGEFDTYEPSQPTAIYDEIPFGIAAFMYKERKRLIHLLQKNSLWTDFVSQRHDNKGNSKDKQEMSGKAYKRICADVLTHIFRIHLLGYQGSYEVVKNHVLTDLNLENYGLLHNGRAEAVADYGIFTRRKNLAIGLRRKETEGLLKSLIHHLGKKVEINSSKSEFFISVLDTIIKETLVSEEHADNKFSMFEELLEEFWAPYVETGVSNEILHAMRNAWILYIKNEEEIEANGDIIRKHLIEYYLKEIVVEKKYNTSTSVIFKKSAGNRLVITEGNPNSVNRLQYENLNKCIENIPLKEVRDMFFGKEKAAIVFIKGFDEEYAGCKGLKNKQKLPHTSHHTHDEHRYIFDFSLLDDPETLQDRLFVEILIRKMFLSHASIAKELSVLTRKDLYNPLKRSSVLDKIAKTAITLLKKSQ